MGVRDLSVLRAGPAVRDRVRWSDVDKMDVVYFGRYLRFMEAAEAEFFRAIGFPYDQIAEHFGVWIGRVRLAVDYRAPARLDDEIVCSAQLKKIGGSSMTFAFPIDRADGTRLADGELVLAALERRSLRPTRIPEPLANALRAAG